VIRELEVAVELARRAGDEVRRVFQTAFDVQYKPGNEGPVTEADRRADALIREGLAAAFPGDAILSEETPDDLSRLSNERLWLVDPLDGTRQFIEGVPEFAVMIGLTLRGRAVLGVIHLPMESRTLFGAEGRGVEVIDHEGWRRLPPLGARPVHPDGPVVTLSRSHAGARTRDVAQRLGSSRIIASGSVGRKAALILTAKADAYVTLGARSRHWDACAPDALIRLAGGTFADTHGQPLRYNTEGTLNCDGLVGCRRDLLPEVVAAVAAATQPADGSGGG